MLDRRKRKVGSPLFRSFSIRERVGFADFSRVIMFSSSCIADGVDILSCIGIVCGAEVCCSCRGVCSCGKCQIWAKKPPIPGASWPQNLCVALLW